MKRAKVSIAGSGNVETKAMETRRHVDIMGSGDVVVTGGAKCSVNKMGSGDVRCGEPSFRRRPDPARRELICGAGS